MKRETLHKLLVAILFSPGLIAAQTSPAGNWTTYDEKSGQSQSIVRLTESSGTLTGYVAQVLDPSKAGKRCEACEDERKNKPVVGLTIIRNVKRSTESTQLWEGGDILDPKTGSVYRVRMKLSDDAKTLEVRGYLGTPMFGRTQRWTRSGDQGAY